MIIDYFSQLYRNLERYSVGVRFKFLRNMKDNFTNIDPEHARNAIIEVESVRVKPTIKGKGYFASLLLQPESSEDSRAVGRFYFKSNSAEIRRIYKKYHPNAPFEPVFSRIMGKEEPEILEGDKRGHICHGDVNPSYLNVNYEIPTLDGLPFEEDVIEILRVSIPPITAEEVTALKKMPAKEFNRLVELWFQSS